MQKVEVYSPNQIAGGSFLGGPIAAVYFLRVNFLALGKAAEAQATLIWGGAVVALMLAVLPFLPEKFPNLVIPMLYTYSAQYVAKAKQLEKDAITRSDLFTLKSDWQVFALGVAFLLLFLVMFLVEMFVLEGMGVISVA